METAGIATCDCGLMPERPVPCLAPELLVHSASIDVPQRMFSSNASRSINSAGVLTKASRSKILATGDSLKFETIYVVRLLEEKIRNGRQDLLD